MFPAVPFIKILLKSCASILLCKADDTQYI